MIKWKNAKSMWFSAKVIAFCAGKKAGFYCKNNDWSNKLSKL